MLVGLSNLNHRGWVLRDVGWCCWWKWLVKIQEQILCTGWLQVLPQTGSCKSMPSQALSAEWQQAIPNQMWRPSSQVQPRLKIGIRNRCLNLSLNEP